jgi:hypothetical protein
MTSKRRMWNSLMKKDNLPPFAKPANAIHMQMTEHNTHNK